MDRVLIAAAIVAVAVVVALIVRRRRPDAPTQPAGRVPTQLDRHDFERPDAPWLVAVFTSATCHTCADVVGTSSIVRVMARSTTNDCAEPPVSNTTAWRPSGSPATVSEVNVTTSPAGTEIGSTVTCVSPRPRYSGATWTASLVGL